MGRGKGVVAALVVAVSIGFGTGAMVASGAATNPASTTVFACLKSGSLSNVTTNSHKCTGGAILVSWGTPGIPAGDKIVGGILLGPRGFYQGQNLSHIDFSGANLEGADMRNTNLTGATGLISRPGTGGGWIWNDDTICPNGRSGRSGDCYSYSSNFKYGY